MRILIVGLGSMGKRRVRNLQRLGVEDITGFDPRSDRRDEAATLYKINTVANWDEAAALSVDGWVVSTPPDTHADYAMQAVDRGIGFFTEANVADERTAKLIERLNAAGVVGAPSCTMRYYQGPRKMRALIDEGAIGRPLSFTYQSGQYLPDWHPWESYKDFYVSKRQTGACREIVPFELAWLTDIFGNVHKLAAMKDKLTDLDTDIDDIYQLLLRFESGVMGHLLVDVLARPAVRLFRLNGSEGTIEWNHSLNEVRLWRAGAKDWERFDLGAGTVEKGYIHAEEPYIDEMADFLSAIRREKPWPYSYIDDERVNGLLLAAEESDAKGIFK